MEQFIGEVVQARCTISGSEEKALEPGPGRGVDLNSDAPRGKVSLGHSFGYGRQGRGAAPNI
eukprot:49280-Prorocentrum_lima.AAC.1